MARSYSQITTAIWRDGDFRTLTAAAQRTYMMLFSQADISAAGVLPMTIRRWAALATDTKPRDIEEALDELQEARFIIVDDGTEELLVRSFVKWDGGHGNPTRRKSIIKAALAVDSIAIRAALGREFRRLDLPTDGLPDAPWHAPSHEAGDDVRVVVKQVEGDSNPQPTTRNPNTSAAADGDEPRPEIERLCQRLADHIEANGSKRPTVTQRWRNAVRLMIDRDGRTEQQITAAIDWSQNDEFWRSNVLSMPKLREKYEQMRLQAERRNVSRRQTETDQMFERAMTRAKAREAQ